MDLSTLTLRAIQLLERTILSCPPVGHKFHQSLPHTVHMLPPILLLYVPRTQVVSQWRRLRCPPLQQMMELLTGILCNWLLLLLIRPLLPQARHLRYLVLPRLAVRLHLQGQQAQQTQSTQAVNKVHMCRLPQLQRPQAFPTLRKPPIHYLDTFSLASRC